MLKFPFVAGFSSVLTNNTGLLSVFGVVFLQDSILGWAMGGELPTVRRCATATVPLPWEGVQLDESRLKLLHESHIYPFVFAVIVANF